MQEYLKRMLVAILMVAVGCARASTTQGSPSFGWPSYPAVGYDQVGHPPLTDNQAALIHKTLALTSPCQASRLRYAFPREEPDTIVLFFETGPPAGASFHILWTYNLFYDAMMGQTHAVSYAMVPRREESGTAYEVQHQDCP